MYRVQVIYFILSAYLLRWFFLFKSADFFLFKSVNKKALFLNVHLLCQPFMTWEFWDYLERTIFLFENNIMIGSPMERLHILAIMFLYQRNYNQQLLQLIMVIYNRNKILALHLAMEFFRPLYFPSFIWKGKKKEEYWSSLLF